jgi:hypothetical protein
VLYRNRAGAACPHTIHLSMRASDTALGLPGTKQLFQLDAPDLYIAMTRSSKVIRFMFEDYAAQSEGRK